MVQLTNFSKLRPESELPIRKTLAAVPAAVKLEVEDHEEHGPFNKKPKMVPSFQQLGADAHIVPTEAMPCSFLEEPSPLGLRLRKSPSVVDFFQMKLSQVNATATQDSRKKKDTRTTGTSAHIEKLKASNFPASLLKIGTWEYASRYEGDLVAKCYFAKHKLVWEVLEGGLKSKIEVQWSDIAALKATCPENGPGTLDIVLARQPLFFRETNPQPRKHTLWQATSDFTDGQASIHRRHFLQCPQGLLNKHFEKLIQCDPRLHSLSRQPDMILEHPFFEPRCSVFEDQDVSKCPTFNSLQDAYGSPIQGLQDSALPYAGPSISTDPLHTTKDVAVREVHSPISVMDTEVINNVDQFRVPGLRPSMSMSDLAKHITEQIYRGNHESVDKLLQSKEVLEQLSQYLLNDSNTFSQLPISDERSLLSKVNSFCSLIQAVQNSGGDNGTDSNMLDNQGPATQGQSGDISEFKRAPTISRKESFEELLMHLPRIASLPTFLPNISEES